MAMLARLKWRIALSLANVLIAAVLFQLGLNEARRYSYPHANPAPEYVPTTQRISYSMNFPPFMARNLMVNFILPRYRSSLRYRESADYYILVFLFWWWIGWQIDNRGNTNHAARPIEIIGYSLGVLGSFVLFYLAGTLFGDGWTTLKLAAGFLIPTSAVIWGVVLLCFFCKRLMPLFKT